MARVRHQAHARRHVATREHVTRRWKRQPRTLEAKLKQALCGAFGLADGVDVTLSNDERCAIVDDLLALTSSSSGSNLDTLVNLWLAAIRPRWKEALRTGAGRGRRNRLRRLDGLIPTLERNPLSADELNRIREGVGTARPLGERVVATIVGVPTSPMST